MSSVFYAFKDFNVLCFMIYKTSMSFVFYSFKDFNVFYLYDL